MAFKLVGGTQEPFVVELPVTAGVAIAAGDLVDINGNVVQRATSSSTIHTIVGVAAETISTSATKLKVQLIVPGQLWEAEAAAATAATQILESMALTDHDTVNNSDSDVTGPTGVFTCLAVVGSSKLMGEFTRLQSTST